MNLGITLFDFNVNSDLSDWYVVDDVVMGGRSQGNFEINEDGFGEFSGIVSLENNGGFSSIRYNFESKNLQTFKSCLIRLKSNGENYQFRLKKNINDRHTYVCEFETDGDWEIIRIDLNKMIPMFRGRQLDMDLYDCSTANQIGFLIANKKYEQFNLQIDWIKFE